MIAERIKHIGISPTMKIAAKAISMKAENIDVVDFSVGEPDFPTPQFVKDAAKKAIDGNRTKYTVNAGMKELRQAIASKLKEDYGLEYQIEEIIVTNGAKHSLFNTVMAVVNAGDEVIVPSPYWVSYPEMVRVAQGRPVFIQTKEENGFKLLPEQLKQAISANTRAIILCNPSNPTGAAYSRNDLKAIAEVLEQEDIVVIADEIYSKLVYDAFSFNSMASVSKEMKEKTIVINGVSKAYAMTGWRLGFAAGSRDVISAANKIQSHSTSNASAISQFAALEALTGPQYEINRMVAEFQKRRNYVIHKLQTIPGISCHNPEGAFYAFPNISSYFDKEYNGTYIRNSYGLVYYLLKQAHVVCVPGAAFGADDHMRISYATSMEQIEKGMHRIQEALSHLKTPAKLKFVKLSNTRTQVNKHVTIDAQVDVPKRDALVAEAEAQLSYDRYFEWNANINGMVVQLRTNVAHLYDFWVENWYPAQLEAELEPHGIIYAVDGAVGREPYAFFNADTKTGILFNTDYYGSLRRLALGMVTDEGERLLNVHAIRGMSGDYQGAGFVLMGPKGTKKSEIFFQLLNDPAIALHSNDLIFSRYGGGYAAADNPERKLYLPTNTAMYMERLVDLFDRSKCENVVTRKEDCGHTDCPLHEECLMDRGYPYCYYASKQSSAMLDPYWFGGMNKHVKRIDIRTLFILKNESMGPAIQELNEEDALQILETGINRGAVSHSRSG
ncbi:MAG: aminotransferase class I/II-fold pyridoxal phosphate-dependent enzyme, partial [Caldithrix sp.]|nr:aminotransferase class I/II-fold pyridoxal phosphate-dependent enzyme [Caldithrix sp.]